MEQDIREALADIKTSVRDGFDSVNKRIDQLVTKGEFDATVLRLDAQHGTLRRDFDRHETETQAHYKTVQDADAAVRSELLGELEKIRSSQRWALGLLIPAAAVISTVIFGVLSLINR